MKTAFLSAVASLGVLSATAEEAATPSLWTTDFAAARELAAKEGKSLLVDFTGSDWCGWCIKLKKEVFDTPEFKEAAPAKFVLVELDFPSKKDKLSPETQAQNEKLQAEYGIRGFPTLLLMDEKGRPFAQTGYARGGPKPYLENLNSLLDVRAKRDAAWKKAETLAGAEKAQALAEGLSALDEELVAKHYKAVVDEITTLDPADTSGYGKKMRFKAEMEEVTQAVVKTAREERDMAKARKLVDDFIAEKKPQGENLQAAMMLKLPTYGMDEESARAVVSLMEAIVAVDAATEAGQQAAQIKVRATEIAEKLAAEKKDKAGPEKKDEGAGAPQVE